MKRYVLIVAGGKGLRMGAELPKQFIPISGRPVLIRTLECFYAWDKGAERILVIPAAHREYWKRLCEDYDCLPPHLIADGGETRFHSVLSGLEMVAGGSGLVAVHDGARPFVEPELIEACFDAALRYGAAVPVMRMVDSVRLATDDGKSRPVDRSRYLSVQTPQAFRLELLKEAYRQPYTPAFTDDASVVEAMGGEIYTVPGNRRNIKITDPFDLCIAEALLRKS
ncbi:MAG: 2-C-methyl-D-erythritol 4-phosphate cytidylyltransferase [Tannerellaceae bacterium]|jgi:2-C-methyl-D-erythritol 4-phosphate cytidylyltransferase|nr:2-C-methyl-D-erythritol 4-phosphate cytidylyltransferase [Tannerellaceae bacterium]